MRLILIPLDMERAYSELTSFIEQLRNREKEYLQYLIRQLPIDLKSGNVIVFTWGNASNLECLRVRFERDKNSDTIDVYAKDKSPFYFEFLVATYKFRHRERIEKHNPSSKYRIDYFLPLEGWFTFIINEQLRRRLPFLVPRDVLEKIWEIAMECAFELF